MAALSIVTSYLLLFYIILNISTFNYHARNNNVDSRIDIDSINHFKLFQIYDTYDGGNGSSTRQCFSFPEKANINS